MVREVQRVCLEENRADENPIDVRNNIPENPAAANANPANQDQEASSSNTTAASHDQSNRTESAPTMNSSSVPNGISVGIQVPEFESKNVAISTAGISSLPVSCLPIMYIPILCIIHKSMRTRYSQ